MITIRKANDRGRTDLGWLDSRHTFSFGRYRDPEFVGFGPLRVINDDVVAPGAGFGEHPHENMEIVSWVVSGALEHRDSTGGGGVLRPGGVQAMSAGTGVAHSEFNGSTDEPVRFLQVWLEPDRAGHAPRYADAHINDADLRNTLRAIVSPDGADGSLPIHRDARILATRLDEGKTVDHDLAGGRAAWVQAVRGAFEVNGDRLDEGDGAAVTGEGSVAIRSLGDAEALVFDLAG